MLEVTGRELTGNREIVHLLDGTRLTFSIGRIEIRQSHGTAGTFSVPNLHSPNPFVEPFVIGMEDHEDGYTILYLLDGNALLIKPGAIVLVGKEQELDGADWKAMFIRQTNEETVWQVVEDELGRVHRIGPVSAALIPGTTIPILNLSQSDVERLAVLPLLVRLTEDLAHATVLELPQLPRRALLLLSLINP